MAYQCYYALIIVPIIRGKQYNPSESAVLKDFLSHVNPLIIIIETCSAETKTHVYKHVQQQ
jgi:hypothetical protein